jgi:hypothetical protein
MSVPSADAPALPPPNESEGWPAGPKPPDAGWPRQKFLFVIGFVLAFHVALICLFGTNKQIIPLAVANVPHLRLADSADEFIALGDPTLFARPNAHDVVSLFWRHMPPVKQPNFDWTEDPGYLPPTRENFGAAFHQFVQDSRRGEYPLNFKPEPKSAPPDVTFDAALPSATTLQISGELAARQLLNPSDLPSLPLNDVIGPSQVRVLVDAGGNVYTATILEANKDNNDADQLALQLARRLRFAPAPGYTFGDLTFTWHTVPTNAVPASLP